MAEDEVCAMLKQLPNPKVIICPQLKHNNKAIIMGG